MLVKVKCRSYLTLQLFTANDKVRNLCEQQVGDDLALPSTFNIGRCTVTCYHSNQQVSVSTQKAAISAAGQVSIALR